MGYLSIISCCSLIGGKQVRIKEKGLLFINPPGPYPYPHNSLKFSPRYPSVTALPGRIAAAGTSLPLSASSEQVSCAPGPLVISYTIS